MDPFDPSYIKDVKTWHDERRSFFIEFKGIPGSMADELKAGLNILISQWQKIRYRIYYNQSKQTIRAEIKYCPQDISKALEDFIDKSDPDNIKSIVKKNQEIHN